MIYTISYIRGPCDCTTQDAVAAPPPHPEHAVAAPPPRPEHAVAAPPPGPGHAVAPPPPGPEHAVGAPDQLTKKQRRMRQRAIYMRFTRSIKSALAICIDRYIYILYYIYPQPYIPHTLNPKIIESLECIRIPQARRVLMWLRRSSRTSRDDS